jgi:putative transposase
MKRQQAFRYRIEPNGAQKRAMSQFAGNARKVWNLAWARQQEIYAESKQFSNSFGMNYWLLAWKEEFPYLQQSPSQTLQQVTKNLDLAFKNFFAKRADFPKLKKKSHSSNSFCFPQGFKLDQKNNRIFLPKLGWMRYRNSRCVLGEIKNVIVNQRSGLWFVSVQTEREVSQPLPTATAQVGIDVGIARFATLSDATYVEPINGFKKHQIRLARYQRRMKHKKKFSRNWIKVKKRIQKIHNTIAHVRQDFLHKTSTSISKNHALVCVEDLQIANMSKSAKGNCEQHGRNVRQKAGLNRAILDQGWGEFRRQLAYKLDWNGGIFLAVDPKNTSRTCPTCHQVCADNRKTQTEFVCVHCDYTNHADVVGAINILERGHRLLACGEKTQSGHSRKQEPTQVSCAHVA